MVNKQPLADPNPPADYPTEYDGPVYVGVEQDEPELVDADYPDEPSLVVRVESAFLGDGDDWSFQVAEDIAAALRALRGDRAPQPGRNDDLLLLERNAFREALLQQGGERAIEAALAAFLCEPVRDDGYDRLRAEQLVSDAVECGLAMSVEHALRIVRHGFHDGNPAAPVVHPEPAEEATMSVGAIFAAGRMIEEDHARRGAVRLPGTRCSCIPGVPSGAQAVTGPEPGDLAEIEVSLGRRTDRLRAFRRRDGAWISEWGGMYSDDQVRVVRPLSVVPTDSLETLLETIFGWQAEGFGWCPEIEQTNYPGAVDDILRAAAAVR